MNVAGFAGARVNLDRVLVDLISHLPDPNVSHVNIQILGDGFRAMRKINFCNIGIRLLFEDEANDNSFTSLATL